MSDVFVHTSPGGRLSTLSEEVIQKILDAVPKVYCLEQTAYLCKIDPSTMRKWLKRGKTEHFNGEDTIFSQFFLRYYEKRAECASRLIDTMDKNKEKFKVNTFLLERTYRRNYGPDNEDKRKFYNHLAGIMSNAGIVNLPSFDSIMEDLELED